MRVPVLAESLHVGARSVGTGRVLIRKRMQVRRTTVELPPHVRVDADIERVPVDRAVDRPEPVRTEGSVTIVPVHEERWVVRRQLFLKEEIHIRPRVSERPEPPRTTTLRHEAVDIQRVPAGRDRDTHAQERAKGAGEFARFAASAAQTLKPRSEIMSITVVGIFDNAGDVAQARERLESSGIGIESIRVDAHATGDGDTLAAEPEKEDRRGFFARLFGFGDDETDERPGTYAEAVRRGSTVMSVQVRDEDEADRIEDILEECGAIDIDERAEQWRAGGYERYDGTAPAYTPEQRDEERNRMQTVQEEMKIGKRNVERGGLRVHRYVTERPVEEQLTLREERATVDRQPVDREATDAELQGAFSDETIEVRESAEEPVVSKVARVVEEVDIGKRASERTETIRDTVRRSDVDVERIGEGAVERGLSYAEERAMAAKGGDTPSGTKSRMTGDALTGSVSGGSLGGAAMSGGSRGYTGPERRGEAGNTHYEGPERRRSKQ